MTRFEKGDWVLIRKEPIASRYGGRQGVVIQATGRKAKPGNRTLDKYTVRFADGDQEEFFDVQLAPAGDAGEAKGRDSL